MVGNGPLGATVDPRLDTPRRIEYIAFVARYIAVEGPVGVGKSALARLLAERLGARTVLDPGPNPFLGALYDDPRRWAFQSQLFCLLSRYQQKDEVHQQDLFARGGVVGDYLFACDRITAQLNLGRDELSLYDKVYGLLGTQVPRPDLVVYLQARPEVLAARLRQRGDGRVPARDYIERLTKAYAEFFFQYEEGPLLVVNTSEIDFLAHPPDADELVAVIQRTRAGVSHYSPLGSSR
jgi:deoxyadenosine/deoxycytidine kinase